MAFGGIFEGILMIFGDSWRILREFQEFVKDFRSFLRIFEELCENFKQLVIVIMILFTFEEEAPVVTKNQRQEIVQRFFEVGRRWLGDAGVDVVQTQQQRAGQETFEGGSGILNDDLEDPQQPLHCPHAVRILLAQDRFNVVLIERLQECLHSFLGPIAADLIEKAVENRQIKIEDGFRHLCNPLNINNIIALLKKWIEKNETKWIENETKWIEKIERNEF